MCTAEGGPAPQEGFHVSSPSPGSKALVSGHSCLIARDAYINPVATPRLTWAGTLSFGTGVLLFHDFNPGTQKRNSRKAQRFLRHK